MNNINIELDDELFTVLSLKAHEFDVTLTEYIKGRLTAELPAVLGAVTGTVDKTNEGIPTETTEETPNTLTRPPMPVKAVEDMPGKVDLEPPQQRGAPLYCERSVNTWK